MGNQQSNGLEQKCVGTKDTRIQVPNPYESPFNAIGQIRSHHSENGIVGSGTGVLISKRHVLTVAHNIYAIIPKFNFKSQADQVYFYPQIYDQNKKKQRIKIKVKSKKYYCSKYTTLGDIDRRFYDIAVLQLEDNNYIKDNQFLEMLWNWKDPQKKIQVTIVGYPGDKNKDKLKRVPEQFQSVLFSDTKTVIKIMESFIEYMHTTDEGQSGGPLLVKVGGVYKIIGLHQGTSIDNKYNLAIRLTSQPINNFRLMEEWVSSITIDKPKIDNPGQDKQKQYLKKELIELRSQNVKLKSQNQRLKKTQQLIKSLNDSISNIY